MVSIVSVALSLLMVAVAFHSSRAGETKEVMICAKNTIDPTYMDILKYWSSPEIDIHVESFVSTISTADFSIGNSSLFEVLKEGLDTNFPVKSVISDGYFTLSYERAQNAFTFNDIYLIYEKSMAMNLFCESISYLFGPWNSLCNCGSDLVGEDALFQGSDSTYYCVQKSACTDKTVTQGYCEIFVNPFSSSCVLIVVPEHVEDALVTGSAEYKQQIVTFYDLLASLFGGVEHSLAAKRRRSVYQSSASSGSDANGGTRNPYPSTSAFNHRPMLKDAFQLPIPPEVEIVVVKALDYIPLYLINFVVGLYITSNARDLADQATMQLIMEAIFGVFLAFIVIAYQLHKSSRQMLGKYGGPIAELANIPLSLSVVSMIIANPKMLQLFLYATMAFWHTGAPFGIWWLGKAYFLGSIVLCVGVCHYFDMFQPDSKSWYMMYYSIKLTGVVLLSQSSSSRWLSFILVVYGIFEDQIRHYLWILYLVGNVAVKKPTYKFISPRKMSMTEVEKISKSHTQKSLLQLRQHLFNNPAEMDLVMDKFRESGKKDEVYLMSRFVKGRYPGTPYTVDNNEAAPDSRIWRLPSVYYFLSLLAVVLAGLYAYQYMLDAGMLSGATAEEEGLQ